MNKINSTYKNKKFRYGAFSTLTAVIVVAVLVVVTLVASQLKIKYDLTKDKMFSVTDKSKELLKDLDKEVNIYALFVTGQEDPSFKEILDQYAEISDKIKVVYKDPYKYPKFVGEYQKDETPITINSIIVECGDRYKVIDSSDLVSYTYDQQTYQKIPVSIDIEPKVTNAIQYVLKDKTNIIYALTGHNEAPLAESYIKILDDANFEYKTLDMTLEQKIPEDMTTLVITTPQKDISKAEADKIKEYLENNGKALFVIDYVPYELPNLMSVLNYYGVEIGNYYVQEGDTNFTSPEDNTLFIPQLVAHDITNNFIAKKRAPFIYRATGVTQMKEKRNSLTITPFLSSTSKAYGKTNPEALSMNKEEGDLTGPFDVGVAIKDTFYTGDKNFETKIVVLTSTIILNDQFDQSYTGGSNSSFMVDVFSWLSNAEKSEYIPSKSLENTEYYRITQGQSIFLIAFIAIGCPILTLGPGIFIWLRRRNK